MELALLLLSCLLLTSRAVGSSDAVLDEDGQELRRNIQYFVKPRISANGGGLSTARLNGSCPYYVTQETSELLDGRAVLFFPEERQDDDIVRVGSRVYAMFPRPTRCSDSTTWQVDTDTGYVRTGGYVSLAAGPHYSRFAIRRSRSGKSAYVLQSCPCRLCLLLCTSLGVETVAGDRRVLATNNDPLEVVFERVPEESGLRSA